MAVTGAVAASGQQSPDERAFWAAAFETARLYSDDMTLVSYCFRKEPETSARIYLSVIQDMNGVVELARIGAVAPQQVAAFVHKVMDGAHFAAPDADDFALEKACAERDVKKAYLELQPIGWPLAMRAPFKKN
jgi:hypothetical protein